MKLHEITNDEKNIIKTMKAFLLDFSDDARFILNDDNTITITGDFEATRIENSFKGFPYKVKRIMGDFSLQDVSGDINLASFPDVVDGAVFLDSVDVDSFEGWGCESARSLTVRFCDKLSTLKGLPSVVNGMMIIHNCGALKNLEDCPVVGKGMTLTQLDSLESLEGCQRTIINEFTVGHCPSLKSLKGMPKTVGNKCRLQGLDQLESLDGIVRKTEFLYLINLPKLKSLIGIADMFDDIRGLEIQTDIEEGGLGILLIKHLIYLKIRDPYGHPIKWADIISNVFSSDERSIYDAQTELIDAGLDAYAQL